MMDTSMMRTSIVLLVAVLLAGCDPFGTSGATRSAPSVTYETESSSYDASGAIDATLTNTSGEAVYLYFDECFVVKMERRRDEAWVEVSEPFGCTLEAKPPVKMRPGESRPAGVPAGRVDAADLRSGTYRLRVRLSASPTRPVQQTVTANTFTVTSNTFQVVR
jgi:hypothetical protein